MSNKYLLVGVALLAVFAVLLGVVALSEAGRNVESMGLHPGSSSTLSGALTVDDLTTTDDLVVGDDMSVAGDATFSGSVSGISTSTLSSLTVNGNAEITGTLTVNTGSVTGTLTAEQVTSSDDLLVTDDLTVGDDAEVQGDLLAATATITGALAADGGITVDTNAFTVADTSGNTDIAGTLNYGADNLYPVGFASSGQQLVYGTTGVTGTYTVSHGLTTVTFCLAVLGEDPTAAGSTAAYVTVEVAANDCVVKVWQDDLVTASDEADVAVQWMVVGAP